MHVTAQQARIEELEFRLLLDALRQGFGYDFEGYDRTWLEPRVWARVRAEGLLTLSGLQATVLHNEDSRAALLMGLTVSSGGFFGDPALYDDLRRSVLPALRTYPSIAVWYPACGTGEGVYSLSVLLEEAGLYQRCRIYATDVHQAMYQQGKEGAYAVSELEAAEDRYRRAGGQRQLSDYYVTKDDYAVMATPLRANIAFLEHQLSTDGVFHEFQLIVADHLGAPFGPSLQTRVRRLFRESLDRCGLLVAGSYGLEMEESGYAPLNPQERVYRKIPSGRDHTR